MSNADHPFEQTAHWKTRGLQLAAALGLVAVIVLMGIAWKLQPSQSGLGTHHQLGLPPCSFRVVFGIRCPSCGMTTSWAHFVRGQWISAAHANVGGLMLAVYSLVALPVIWKVMRSGRLPAEPIARGYSIALIVIAVVTLTEWLIRLTR